MKLFRECNIRVITFPPHSTHVLQPFDAVVAKLFKSNFNKAHLELRGNTLDEEENSKQTIDMYRRKACIAIQKAWAGSIDFLIAQKAFACTGLRPFNTGVMIAARGVNLSERDPEKELRKCSDTLHITSTELTSQTFIEKLNNYKQAIKKEKHKHNDFPSCIFFKMPRSDAQLIESMKSLTESEENKSGKRIKPIPTEILNLEI